MVERSESATRTDFGGDEPVGEMWQSELAQLDSDATSLETQMRKAAGLLRDAGAVPSSELVTALLAFRDLFREVGEAVTATLQATKGHCGVGEMPNSLNELKDLAGQVRIAAADRAKRLDAARKALSPLEEVLRLKCRGDNSFPALDQCQTEAMSLHERLMATERLEDDPEFVQVRDGSHPLCQFLRFVTEFEGLSLEQTELLRQTVADQYGNLLAMAVMRSFITLPTSKQDKASMPTEPTSGQTSPPETDGTTVADTNAAVDIPAGECTDMETPEASPTDAVMEQSEKAAVTQCREDSSDDSPVEPSEPLRETNDQDKPVADGVSCTDDCGEAACPVALATTPISEFVSWARNCPEQGMTALIWGLMRDGRCALAYHVARSVEATKAIVPASDGIRAILLASLVRGDYNNVEDEYRKALEGALVRMISGPADSPEENARCTLLFAMTLAPALLARASGARDVLQSLRLPKLIDGVHGLRQSVLQFARLNIAFSRSVLRGVHEHSQWRSDLSNLRAQCEEWLHKANQRSIIYAPTTQVWREWLKEERPLGAMLSSVIKDQRHRLAEVADFVASWRDRTYFERQVHKTDKDLRSRDADLRQIHARALTGLRKHVDAALNLIMRWKSLLDSEPSRLSDYDSKQAAQCRVEVTAELAKAVAHLESQANRQDISLPELASVNVLKSAIDHMESLFSPSSNVWDVTHSIEWLLACELLPVAGVDLGEDGEADWLADPQVRGRLLDRCQTDNKIDWLVATKEQCEAGHFVNARRIVSLIAETDPEIADKANAQTIARLDEARKRLQMRRNDVEARVHRANVDGLLSETLFHDLRAQLDLNVSDCELMHPAYRALDQVQDAVEQARQEKTALIRDRLARRRRPSSDNQDRQRIERVLSAGDVLTADEYLTMLEQGQPLPPEVSQGEAKAFFPDFLLEMRRLHPKMPSPSNIVHELRAGKNVGALHLERMPKAAADEAVALINAWRKALGGRNNPDSLRPNLQKVLAGLGFMVRKLSLAKAWKDCAAFDLEVDALGSRDICILPQFGSEAHGRYRILCLWGSPLEHTILQLITKQPRNVPVLVIYLAPMDDKRRRALAHESRQQNRHFILLDTYLLLYVCSQRNRLAALLKNATWFTAGRPYTTTGSVPPEMFYGRKRQKDLILDPRGTNLVFGGRQLGKTALLREIERTEHRPNEGVVVRWIDLTHGENIGTTRAISDIWSVLATRLSEHDICRRNVSTPEKFEQAVVAWLEQSTSRRILLLLDEADAFLAADRTESQPAWSQLASLKSLMDKTQFQFKAVFAGLHNVQRTARDPNTPLAHLGEPACIGAFLAADEVREAYRMIVEPLNALGYQFESSDLPTRILAYTNYYPSLIQVFCRSLLEYLQKEPFDPSWSPPYQITLRHIERAYFDSKSAILQRFNWSLDLDERYRVLALVIALEIMQPEGVRPSEGLSISLIRREAMSYWPQGFADDTSLEAFRALLDEMIGLGILRMVRSDVYALRSPNVINLLGTKEQIERQLEEAADRNPPAPYEASSFRRKIDGEAWTRSPLTAAQESELLRRDIGVGIIFGCRAAGLAEVPSALAQLPQVQVVNLPATMTERPAFQKELHSAIQARRNGLSIIVVSAERPWSKSWIADAIDLTTKHRGSTSRLFRVVFVGGHQHAWEWLKDGGVHSPGRSEPLCLTLHAWHEHAVNRWLDDIGVGRSQDQLRLLRRATGSWGGLLHEVGKELSSNPVGWRETMAAMESRQFTSEDLDRWFGWPQTSLAMLKTFAALGHTDDGSDSEPLGPDDLRMFLEGPAADEINTSIRWAELMGYVRLNVNEHWILNSLLTRVLRNL